MKKNKAYILAKAVYSTLNNTDDKEKVVSSFIIYLEKHSLLTLIPNILEELENIHLEEKDIIKTEILSSEELNKEELDNISRLLKNKLNKDINIKTKQDKNLLGGLVIKYKDKIIDLSLKKQLKNLNKQLNS